MDDNDEEKRTEQNLIVRSGKPEAEAANNRRLRSTYCTIEANCWQTRRIARPLYDNRATCIIVVFLSETLGSMGSKMTYHGTTKFEDGELLV